MIAHFREKPWNISYAGAPLFANQRQTLYAEYQGIFPERLHTPMSLQSLLGHQWDPNITLREEELIKDALFKFLLHTGKLL